MTIRQEELPENSTLDDVLEDVNGEYVVRDGVLVYIVDGHHRDAVLGVLHGTEEPEWNWARENIPVFVTMRVDGSTMSAVEY